MKFEWSSHKAAVNKAKHAITFEEALTVFADKLAKIFDDEAHSAEEYREIIIGHSSKRRLLIVSFTERSGSVRIISARKATKHEQHDYEENASQQ